MPLVQKEWSTFHFCSPRDTSVNALSVTLKAQNPQGVSQWLKAQKQTGDESRVGNCSCVVPAHPQPWALPWLLPPHQPPAKRARREMGRAVKPGSW